MYTPCIIFTVYAEAPHAVALGRASRVNERGPRRHTAEALVRRVAMDKVPLKSATH